MKKRVKKICAILLISALLQLNWLQSGAAFSLGEEREVGEKLLFQIRLAFQVLDDPDIHQYINHLGYDVLEVAGIQYFDYHFFIINNKEFNAFAAPSGLIFFHSGLIETMNSENELVSVLAHEIGHVVSRHLASRMEKGSKVAIATMALALASLALGGGVATQALLTTSLATGQAINLHFSRKDEEEADLLAYGWMKKLGRDPVAQEKMLYTMRRITRYRMGQVPQYLLTHPDPEARLDYVQGLLAIEGAQEKEFEPVNDFAFLRMKYRILAEVKDGMQLRAFLAGKIADGNAGKIQQKMAKYGLSQLDRKENNYESSLELLKEVQRFFPNESILLVDLGLVEFELGMKEMALGHFKEAYDNNRNDMWAAFQLAKVYLNMGDAVMAERYLQEVATVLPEYAKIYYELGRLRSSEGDKAAASFYLGKFYLLEGKVKLAKENFIQADKESEDLKIKSESKRMLETIKRLEES